MPLKHQKWTRFLFFGVSINDVFKETKRLKARKATMSIYTPVKVLKESAGIFSAYICDFLNETIRSGKFPAILKDDDVRAVLKKKI